MTIDGEGTSYEDIRPYVDLRVRGPSIGALIEAIAVLKRAAEEISGVTVDWDRK